MPSLPTANSFCSFLCCWGWDTSPHTKFNIAKWVYFGFWTLTVVITWILRDYAADSILHGSGQVATFCGEAAAGDQKACSSGQIAIRLSFGNFMFFTINALLTLHLTNSSSRRIDLHAGYWLPRLIIWMSILIGFFYLPSKSIYGYAQFARVCSGIFLIIQLILLINFLYEINEALIEEADRDNRKAWAVLVTGALTGLGLGLTCIILAYTWYTAKPSCYLNIFFCTFSLVMAVALVGVLFLPNRAETAGLLTSGLVFLYTSFLLLSALSSQPKESFEECQRGTGANPRWIQVVGFFIALATVCYSTFTGGVSYGDMVWTDTDDPDPLPYRADFFHAMYALASMYIAMLFSNWEVSASTREFELDVGTFSMWVKMASKWTCELLYIWTVVAPAIFTNRHFGR